MLWRRLQAKLPPTITSYSDTLLDHKHHALILAASTSDNGILLWHQVSQCTRMPSPLTIPMEDTTGGRRSWKGSLPENARRWTTARAGHWYGRCIACSVGQLKQQILGLEPRIAGTPPQDQAGSEEAHCIRGRSCGGVRTVTRKGLKGGRAGPCGQVGGWGFNGGCTEYGGDAKTDGRERGRDMVERKRRRPVP